MGGGGGEEGGLACPKAPRNQESEIRNQQGLNNKLLISRSRGNLCELKASTKLVPGAKCQVPSAKCHTIEYLL